MIIQPFPSSIIKAEEPFNPKRRKIEERAFDIAIEALELLASKIKNAKNVLYEAEKEVSICPRVQRKKNRPSENRSGEIWEYVKSEKGEIGSFFIFKQRAEFNQVEIEESTRKSNYASVAQKLIEMFPAIEPEGRHLEKNLRYKKTTDLSNSENLKDVFCRLGFEWFILEEDNNRALYLKIPDLEELENQWKKERARSPELPPLNIFPCEGSSTNESFIKTNLFYDVILSTGKEFIHDSIFHLLASLQLMISSGSQYAERKKRMVEWTREPYLRLKRIQKLMESIKGNLEKKHEKILKNLIEQSLFCIASKTDSLGVHSDYSYIEERILKNPLSPVLGFSEIHKMPPNVKQFVEKNFKESAIKYEEIPLLWEKMREVEKALQEASLK